VAQGRARDPELVGELALGRQLGSGREQAEADGGAEPGDEGLGLASAQVKAELQSIVKRALSART